MTEHIILEVRRRDLYMIPVDGRTLQKKDPLAIRTNIDGRDLGPIIAEWFQDCEPGTHASRDSHRVGNSRHFESIRIVRDNREVLEKAPLFVAEGYKALGGSGTLSIPRDDLRVLLAALLDSHDGYLMLHVRDIPPDRLSHIKNRAIQELGWILDGEPPKEWK